MKDQRISFYNFLLIFIMFVSLLLFGIENANIHGQVTNLDISSNVSLQKSLSISFSDSLYSGIEFGEVNFLPAYDVNAIGNYNITDNSTNYYVLVSEDGNVAVDLCVMANSGLISSVGDEIGVGNETYSVNLNFSNYSLPSLSSEIPFSLDYVRAGDTIPIGNKLFFRFFLDVPAGQPAGSYNNSIFFKGVSEASSC